MKMMKPFDRNDPDYASAIERAVRAHNHVRRVAVNRYQVRSRRANQAYLVTLMVTRSGAIVPFCDCEAGQRGRVCHHAVSAILLHSAFERGFTRRTERHSVLPDGALVRPLAQGNTLDGWTI